MEYNTASVSQSAQDQTNYLVRAKVLKKLEEEQKPLTNEHPQGKSFRRETNTSYPTPCFSDIYNRPTNYSLPEKSIFSKDEQLAIFVLKQEKERNLQDILTAQAHNLPKTLTEQKLQSNLTEKFNATLYFIEHEATPEQKQEIAKALGLGETHTNKFNISKEFISNGITPEETRELKLRLRDKIKEFNQKPETAIKNICLSTVTHRSSNVGLVEHITTKFSNTTRAIPDEELKDLDFSKFDSVAPKARAHLESRLK